MTIKRRQFLTGAAAGGAGAATLASVPTIGRAARPIKMVTGWPKNFPGLGTSSERFAQRLRLISDGKLEVKIFAGGELVSPFEMLDAVGQGTAEMSHGTAYYWQGKSRAFTYFATVPFGMLPNEHMAWLMFGGGQELWDELGAGFGVKPFPCGNTGVQMGGWYRVEINSVDDLKGLKVRMPGLGGEIFARLGATPVTLPGGELFTSLQNGAIDGAEWVAPWNDLAFGLHKVAQYYYYPGFHEPGHTAELNVNLDFWNDLTESEQTAIRVTSQAECTVMMAEFNTRNVTSLKPLVEDHGVSVRRYPDDLMEAFAKIGAEVMAEESGKNATIAKISESYQAFQKSQQTWAALADRAIWETRGM